MGTLIVSAPSVRTIVAMISRDDNRDHCVGILGERVLRAVVAGAARVLDSQEPFIFISRRLAAFPIGFGACCRRFHGVMMDPKRFSIWTSFLPQLFDRKIYGTTAGAWIVFVLIAVLTFATLMAIRGVLKRTLGKVAARTSSKLDDLVVALIGHTQGFVLFVLALYAGSLALSLTRNEIRIAGMAVALAILVQIGLWGNLIIGYAIEHALHRRQEEDPGLATAAGALNFITRLFLWSLVALLMMSSLQLNITALVAGLGIGGVAVALALQNILGDLFASLSILIDKPFAVGHFIVIDDLAGTVEHVGVKSTRVRSLSGEEIVLSNSDLLKCRIHNYKRLFERRILFGFGVTYDTSAAKLAAIPSMIRGLIEDVDKTRFDRAHFKEFADSSLNFEVVYFVLDPDYNLYMDIQQQINLGMVSRFAHEGIEFAFPTRTLLIPARHSSSSSSPTVGHASAQGATRDNPPRSKADGTSPG